MSRYLTSAVVNTCLCFQYKTKKEFITRHNSNNFFLKSVPCRVVRALSCVRPSTGASVVSHGDVACNQTTSSHVGPIN